MKASPLLLSVLVALSCAPSRKPPEVAEVKLPDTYASAPEAEPLLPIPWQDYFRDPQLVQIIQQGVGQNFDVRIALQRIEVARAGVRQATGARLPEVALVAGAGIRKFGLYTMDGAGNAGTAISPGRTVPVHLPDFYVGLQASWEVDIWGRLRHLKDAAVAQYLETVEGTNLVLSNVVSEIALAYFELAALDGSIEILEQTTKRQADALDLMRIQKVAGRVNELAVQQFAGQLASTRALEAGSKQQARHVENRLSLLAGKVPHQIARPRDALTHHTEDAVPMGVPSDLLRNRPDIRAAELRVRAAGGDLKAARAAFYPSIDITGSVGYQAFSPRFLFSTPESIAYSLAGGLVAPLVNRSAIRAQFDQASALQVQALYEYQKSILEGFTEVANSLASVERASEIVAQRRAQRDAVAETVTTADLLFQTGNATYLEVLTAQQNTLAADLELVEALKSERIARVLLYKALGGGWR